MECCKWHKEPELNTPMHRNRRYGIVRKKVSLWPQSGKNCTIYVRTKGKFDVIPDL